MVKKRLRIWKQIPINWIMIKLLNFIKEYWERKGNRLKKIRRKKLEKLNYGIDLWGKRKRLQLRSMLNSMVKRRWIKSKRLLKKNKKKNKKIEKSFHVQFQLINLTWKFKWKNVILNGKQRNKNSSMIEWMN